MADPRRKAKTVPCGLRERAGGFSLVEILTVLAIITILISILIPLVGRVRRSAFDANTKNEVSQIASACQRYFDVFGDYPGPLSNSDIESSYVSANPNYTIMDSYGTRLKNISSSENLVLGLLGGISLSGTNIVYINQNSTGVGGGPSDLSGSAIAKQYSSFLPVTYPGSNMLYNGGYYNGTGTTSYQDEATRAATDSEIPVFVDQFPDSMPILYVRARKGAPGVLSGNASYASTTTLVKDPITNAPAFYNYDIRELTPYTASNASLSVSGIGVNTNGGGLTGNPGITTKLPIHGQHGLQGVGTVGNPGSPVPLDTVDNGGQYFLNAAVQLSNTSAPNSQNNNRYGTPRQKDSFIIIAAGLDRTYGTTDDDTNFGDVQPQ